MTDQPIGIGARLWAVDPWNARSGYWPWIIFDRTRTSWIVGRVLKGGTDTTRPVRITMDALKTLKTERHMQGAVWVTDARRMKTMWLDANFQDIRAAFEGCRDIPTLRQIATILNIETKEPEL